MKMTGLNGAQVLEIVKLRNELSTIVEAYTNREHSIISQFADHDSNGNPIITDGIAKVSDSEKEREAKQALYTLQNEEVQIETPIIRITEDKMVGIVPISGEDIIHLQGLIEFGGE